MMMYLLELKLKGCSDKSCELPFASQTWICDVRYWVCGLDLSDFLIIWFLECWYLIVVYCGLLKILYASVCLSSMYLAKSLFCPNSQCVHLVFFVKPCPNLLNKWLQPKERGFYKFTKRQMSIKSTYSTDKKAILMRSYQQPLAQTRQKGCGKKISTNGRPAWSLWNAKDLCKVLCGFEISFKICNVHSDD